MKTKYFILLIFGLSVLTLLYVRSRFLVVELSYQVNSKSDTKRGLDKKKRELNLELSVLQSPRRIEERAREKYGLKYADENQQKVFIKSKTTE